MRLLHVAVRLAVPAVGCALVGELALARRRVDRARPPAFPASDHEATASAWRECEIADAEGASRASWSDAAVIAWRLWRDSAHSDEESAQPLTNWAALRRVLTGRWQPSSARLVQLRAHWLLARDARSERCSGVLADGASMLQGVASDPDARHLTRMVLQALPLDVVAAVSLDAPRCRHADEEPSVTDSSADHTDARGVVMGALRQCMLEDAEFGVAGDVWPACRGAVARLCSADAAGPCVGRALGLRLMLHGMRQGMWSTEEVAAVVQQHVRMLLDHVLRHGQHHLDCTDARDMLLCVHVLLRAAAETGLVHGVDSHVIEQLCSTALLIASAHAANPAHDVSALSLVRGVQSIVTAQTLSARDVSRVCDAALVAARVSHAARRPEQTVAHALVASACMLRCTDDAAALLRTLSACLQRPTVLDSLRSMGLSDSSTPPLPLRVDVHPYALARARLQAEARDTMTAAGTAGDGERDDTVVSPPLPAPHRPTVHVDDTASAAFGVDTPSAQEEMGLRQPSSKVAAALDTSFAGVLRPSVVPAAGWLPLMLDAAPVGSAHVEGVTWHNSFVTLHGKPVRGSVLGVDVPPGWQPVAPSLLDMLSHAAILQPELQHDVVPCLQHVLSAATALAELSGENAYFSDVIAQQWLYTAVAAASAAQSKERTLALTQEVGRWLPRCKEALFGQRGAPAAAEQAQWRSIASLPPYILEKVCAKPWSRTNVGVSAIHSPGFPCTPLQIHAAKALAWLIGDGANLDSWQLMQPVAALLQSKLRAIHGVRVSPNSRSSAMEYSWNVAAARQLVRLGANATYQWCAARPVSSPQGEQLAIAADVVSQLHDVDADDLKLRSYALRLANNVNAIQDALQGRRVSEFYGDHLHPVVIPALRDSEHPQLDVVLMHGLQGAAVKTWRTPEADPLLHPEPQPDLLGGASSCAFMQGCNVNTYIYKHNTRMAVWPAHWLPSDLAKNGVVSRVIAVTYDSDILAGSIRPPVSLREVARTVGQQLRDAHVGDGRPTLFIAHSMGGILAKLVLTDPRNEQLAQNVHGVVFFATPHAGSPIANFFGTRLTAMPRWLLPNPVVTSHVMDLADYASLRELDVAFKQWLDHPSHSKLAANIVSLAEGRATTYEGAMIGKRGSTGALGTFVVPSQSAWPPYGQHALVSDADHVETCKPPTRDDLRYALALQVALRCVQDEMNSVSAKELSPPHEA